MSAGEFEKRVNRIRKAVSFEQADAVPSISVVNATWFASQSPYPAKECYYDPKKMKEATTSFVKKYDFDAYMDNGARHRFKFTDILGGGTYKIADDGSISFKDNTLLTPDLYDLFISDRKKAHKVMFQKKYPNVTTKTMSDAISEFLSNIMANSGNDAVMFKQELQRPVLASTNVTLPPLEFVVNSGLIGIKDCSIELRRHKEKMLEISASMWPDFRKELEAKLAADNNVYALDLYTSMLVHSFMSAKQFEIFYWPYLKEIAEVCAENNKKMLLFCEAEILRLADFFRELPKDTILLHIEQDDIYETRERLPNIALAGGMPLILLAEGTKEQVVDKAKELIDRLGSGFVMSQTKMAAYPNDIKSENLSALCEFMNSQTI